MSSITLFEDDDGLYSLRKLSPGVASTPVVFINMSGGGTPIPLTFNWATNDFWMQVQRFLTVIRYRHLS